MGSDTAGFEKARQLDVQIQSQQAGYMQSQQILQAARQQVADQEKKLTSAMGQLQISYHSLNHLLNRTDVEALQPEQIELILNEEKRDWKHGQRRMKNALSG